MLLRTFLDKNHSFLDIGAWIGPISLFAAPLCRHVYSIEPDPVALNHLLYNTSFLPNITVIPLALGERDGTTVFGGNGEMGNSESTMLVREEGYTKKLGAKLRTNVGAEEAWRATGTITVAMTSIETIEKTHDLSDCNLVKIDIEGGEKFVIPALLNFFRKKKPTLILSLHPTYLTQKEIREIVKMLRDTYPYIYVDPNFQHHDSSCPTLIIALFNDVSLHIKLNGFLRRKWRNANLLAQSIMKTWSFISSK